VGGERRTGTKEAATVVQRLTPLVLSSGYASSERSLSVAGCVACVVVSVEIGAMVGGSVVGDVALSCSLYI
jgi:hypothetical protein